MIRVFTCIDRCDRETSLRQHLSSLNYRYFIFLFCGSFNICSKVYRTCTICSEKVDQVLLLKMFSLMRYLKSVVKRYHIVAASEGIFP